MTTSEDVGSEECKDALHGRAHPSLLERLEEWKIGMRRMSLCVCVVCVCDDVSL